MAGRSVGGPHPCARIAPPLRYWGGNTASRAAGTHARDGRSGGSDKPDQVPNANQRGAHNEQVQLRPPGADDAGAGARKATNTRKLNEAEPG